VTVLVIEDNVANIRLIEQAMRRCDNVVLLTAIQGRLGLDIAAQHQPDLILLDLHLPDVSGDSVLRHLHADPATASIPVVVCSADASPGQPQHMIDRGAAGYLTKPYLLSTLYSMIEHVRAGEPLDAPETESSS
jgi:CheY-like chemotaxis protein